jgi:hypothetical protein
MTQTCKLIIPGVKDNDGPIDSHGLCPCLWKIDRSVYCFDGHRIAHHSLH